MIVNELIPEPQAMRNAFCDKLIALAENDPDLVVLDADLMGAMGTKPFLKRFPTAPSTAVSRKPTWSPWPQACP